MDELASGLWSWSCRHPEWHPGEFGAEVDSFAARSAEALLVIDPLLPEDPAAVLELLDAEAEAAGRVAILISVPYHTRSSEHLWERWRRRLPVSLHGHTAVRTRLPNRIHPELAVIAPGETLPGGVMPYAIGKPRRYETPLYLPGHGAIVFGDAVAGVGEGLRVWSERRIDERVRAFYRERFNPTLEPLLELGAERILTGHGPSVLAGGTEALAEALAAEPWYHRP